MAHFIEALIHSEFQNSNTKIEKEAKKGGAVKVGSSVFEEEEDDDEEDDDDDEGYDLDDMTKRGSELVVDDSGLPVSASSGPSFKLMHAPIMEEQPDDDVVEKASEGHESILIATKL